MLLGGKLMRILLAEDDGFLATGLALALKDSGYQVDHVSNGVEADLALGVTEYDLMILDLGLPKLDGLEVLRRSRSRGLGLPVLILTARDSLNDRVTGLDVGANDYLTKPFELPELEARVRALLRKDQWSNKLNIACGSLNFDTGTRTASIEGERIDLSAREIAILEILLQNRGRVVSKTKITEHLSSWETEVSFNAIDIAMHRLRKKLEPAGLDIATIRGLGYLIAKE
jgi:two-component system, OmpR family, response regulator